MECGKLVENNPPNATRRKQLVEIKGRKTGRKHFSSLTFSSDVITVSHIAR